MDKLFTFLLICFYSTIVILFALFLLADWFKVGANRLGKLVFCSKKG